MTLNNIDLSKINNIHIIGLISPFSSFCAQTLLNLGKKITASEYEQNHPLREKWEKIGVLYPGGHDEKFVTKDTELVVYPTAPIPNNPECEKAEKLGIPNISISQLLNLISKDYKTIAIAGTHGKTTTSALITWLIHKTIGTPNFIVGDSNDHIVGLDKNWNVNTKSEYLVLEACEYKRQFLDRAPNPYVSVITHIELDHTDYFKDQNDFNLAFQQFLENTKSAIVIDRDAKNEKVVIAEVVKKKPKVKIFDVSDYRDKIKFDSKLFGKHNYENMLRAYATGKALGIPHKKCIDAINSFPGISSRFEYVGKTRNKIPVYKDFAHNPAKLKACIQGAKEKYPNSRIIMVYQPHSFERSYTFRNELAEALTKADKIIFPNIFSPKRETQKERELISEEEFFNILSTKNDTLYTRTFEKTIKKINMLKGDKIIILASAGDLGSIIPDIT